jgi:uncharacterized protein YoxC
MNDQASIPTWWFVLSGIFFGLNILFFVGLTIAIVLIVKVLSALQPKLIALETSAQSLVEKVNGIAANVEELTATVKSTVADVGGHARSVASNAQIVSQTASREFERYSPLVMGALTAVKVVRAIGEIRAHNKAKAEQDSKKKGPSKIGTILAIAGHLLGK